MSTAWQWEKEELNIKTEKELSVDYMHSSCIVVRLDWAAGLPAWLIRRFGSPDLTRKTLFTSQKHQSHSSWDLNEDSWLTLSMNIYQVLGMARNDAHLTGIHHSYWQGLALLHQWRPVVSTSMMASTIIPLIPLPCWEDHPKLSRKFYYQLWTWSIDASLEALSSSSCWRPTLMTPPSLRSHLASYASMFISYTKLISY